MAKILPRITCALLFALALGAAPESFSQTVQPSIGSGTEPTAVAVNPITNRIYVANRLSNNVTVIDGATHATTAVAVGQGPEFIAVNPATNKIYVNNGQDSTLSVIDGATNAVTTYPIGSWGPITINPVTNKIYIVRQGNADEVTKFDGDTNSWYTMATDSYSPVAAAINPVNNILYVAHYGTGDVRAVDVSSSSDFPPTVQILLWGKPKYLAINPATNRIYAITDNEAGPIAVINGATNTFVMLQPPAGHGVGARGVAVNPATNKVYAAFSNEVVVVDGATNAMTYIPSGSASGGPVAVGVDALTNKIYVPNADGTLTVINGDTNAATTLAIPSGARSIGVNPVTNTMYVAGTSGISPVDGSVSDVVHTVPLTTTITPLAGNSSGSSATITLNAASSFSPTAPPVRAVYYQLDGVDDGWTRASGSGPYTASLTGLTSGSHTLYAFATDAQDAPSVTTGPQSAPFIGNIASYTFTATTGGATVPGAPGNLSAAAGNAQATFTFSAPTSDGGAAITSYTVNCSPGNKSVSGAASPLTLTSLTNGTTYTCSATATNSVGTGPASNSVTVTPVASLPSFVGAKSRKTHGGAGTFDITIDAAQAIGGAVTVEPRTIGTGHKIVFQFNSAISTPGTATCVDAASNAVGSVSAVAAGNTVEVTVTGVPNAQRVTVQLSNVNGQGVTAAVSLAFLAGDVSADRSVTASDILRVKGHVGEGVAIGNFSNDVDLSGTIDTTDTSSTKADSGLTV